MLIENEKIYVDLPKTATGTILLAALAGIVKGRAFIPSAAFLACVLLMVSETDAAKRRIPNMFVLLMLLPGCIIILTELYLGADFRYTVLNHLGGLFIMSVPLLITSLITKGGVGGGDIKFIAVSGFALGAAKITYAVFIGMCCAALFIVGRIIYRKLANISLKDKKIPAGPFFALGIWTVFLLF